MLLINLETKIRKKDIDMLVEEKVVGHNYKRIDGWIRRNGFSPDTQAGKHPAYVHKNTGYKIAGVNVHAGDVNSMAIKNIMAAIKNHHTEHNMKYHPIVEALSFKEYLSEKLSATLIDNTDENGINTKGADMTGDNRSRVGSVKTANIPIHKLVPNEGYDKMKSPNSQQNVKNLVNTIKSGNAHTIPKITVSEKDENGNHTIIDGHHRVVAAKQAGLKTIPVQILPQKNITHSGNNYENV